MPTLTRSSIARISVALTLAASFVACGVARPNRDDEGFANEGEGASKKIEGKDEPGGGGGGPGGPIDAGKDAKTDTKPDKGLVFVSPAESLASPGGAAITSTCTPQRIDVMLSDPTHECWSFAKTTPTGMWSVAPIFDVPVLRNKACALTWIPSAPACVSPPTAALTLTCRERRTLVWRTPECTLNPAACVAKPTEHVTVGEPRVDLACPAGGEDAGVDAGDSEVGISFGGLTGGCTSCGFAWDGWLYGMNIFGDGQIGANPWDVTDYSSTGYGVTVPSGPFMIQLVGIPNGSVMLSPSH